MTAGLRALALAGFAAQLVALPPTSLADGAPTAVLLRASGPLDDYSRWSPPIELRRLSPYVEDLAFPWVLPVVRELDARLQIVETIAQSRELPVRHAFRILYGSSFLQHNPVANDHDAMLGVHLGPVKVEYARPQLAAEELVDRIEQYLQVMGRVFEHHGAPELAVSDFSVLREGRFKERERVIRLLTASLEDVVRGREQRLLVERSDGLGVPNVLSSRESYIYETTRIKFLSNSVRSIDWMFPGIREVQVMVHFFFRLELQGDPGNTGIIEDFALHPTFLPSGRIMRHVEQLLWAVPFDTASASSFSKVALSSPARMMETRVHMAQQLFSEVERQLGIGDTTKALKRLQQVHNALAPALDSASLSRLSDAVERFLSDENILNCKAVEVMAKNLGFVFRKPELKAMFGASRDTQETLHRMLKQVRELSRRNPQLDTPGSRELIRRTAALSSRLEDSEAGVAIEEAAPVLKALTGWGSECGLIFGPTPERVGEELMKLLDLVRTAGVRPLRVYSLADGTLGVPASEVTRLGLQGNLSERIVEAGGPGYEYRPIELFERPRDNSGRLLPPSDRLWLALGKSAAEKVQRRKLRAALTDDWLRFNRVTEADPSALREIGRELFLARFGNDAVEAWQHSTTAGDGLLALLGTDVEKATGLLRTHLRLVAGVDSAVQAIATLGDGDSGVRTALARAINASSERILEALAVARASRGRSGLSVPRAELAQEQLLVLVSALAELAAGRGTLKELSKTELEVRRLDIAVPSAIVSVSFSPWAPAGKTASVEIRISGREGGASSRAPLLRLSHSASTGPVWELIFALERVDWGVHGASPINPFKPAHTFFDGMPTFRGLAQGEGPEESAARFGEYVEERLIPALAGH